VHARAGHGKGQRGHGGHRRIAAASHDRDAVERPAPIETEGPARLERGRQVRGERRAIEDEGRLRGRGDVCHRDVDVLQRDAGSRA
jgi:hypothetical protein